MDKHSQLLKKVERLEKEVAELYAQKEVKKLDRYIYTVAEVAKILEKTPQAVYAMIDRKELETIKIGCIKISGSEVKRILGYEVTT